MTRTLVIAELGSSWRFGDDHLANAYKLIQAVKACGADVAKFQWTSDGYAMAHRREFKGAECEEADWMYRQYLQYDPQWLHSLKAHCDKVGIEFMCTVYLPEDIEVIAPLVKRFKVSAFEAEWEEFLKAHPKGCNMIVSLNPGKHIPPLRTNLNFEIDVLHCVSEYPTPLENLGLERAELGRDWWKSGLSDHTTSTLTGALAVAAGASIVEKHVRLLDTPQDNPDYPHSLVAHSLNESRFTADCCQFQTYVRNIREAERCM